MLYCSSHRKGQRCLAVDICSTYSVIEGGCIYHHKVLKVVFEGGVVAMPTNHVKWGMALCGEI